MNNIDMTQLPIQDANALLRGIQEAIIVGAFVQNYKLPTWDVASTRGQDIVRAARILVDAMHRD